tara:strand:- start:1672 stop:2298 length:627 start_codon:yes stop_codon:yes gene_type:complete
MIENYSQNYFKAINKSLIESNYKVLDSKISSESFFEKIHSELNYLYKNKKRLFFFGNGASAAFANHMALDFSKNGKILARSLSDSSLLTALSNDYSYEMAMLEYLKIEGVGSDDFVVTISSSGNSPNIISVLEYCKSEKIKTLSLSGLKDDNKSFKLAEFSIHVPGFTYGIIECCHQILLHLILDKFMNIKEWNRNSFQNMSIDEFNL